ncbi:MAG TPA: agmatine deiminase family protein [Candidatus Competibacteraceae bacterium]|nr:agmatine deiminase family protein [Candidatus Competibacteraceae bacterium]
MSETRVLPAEWAPQAAVMLTWPHDQSDWVPWLAQADANFTAIAAAVTRFQPLLVGCRDAAHRRHVQGLLAAAGIEPDRLRLFEVPANDTWVRDHGPITVYVDGQARLLDFQFNGWGGKFDASLDNQVTARLHAAGAFGAVAREEIDLILEGGSIESDGQGTLLTTTQCLLNPNRNRLPREKLEARLAQVLGIRRFLWLEHGHLEGDDTDAHIDTLARFADPHTLIYQGCDDPADSHYPSLQAMAAELAELRDGDGRPYRLIALPWPRPIHDAENGRRLPASYANFLIINGAVLAPTYADPADALALRRLAAAFPDREIIGIDCRTLIRQYGSLHCVTMQIPQGVPMAG